MFFVVVAGCVGVLATALNIKQTPPRTSAATASAAPTRHPPERRPQHTVHVPYIIESHLPANAHTHTRNYNVPFAIICTATTTTKSHTIQLARNA